MNVLKATFCVPSKVDSENNLNPMTWLWCKITVSPTLNQKLSKYVKLTEITTVQVLDFVKTSAHLALSAL